MSEERRRLEKIETSKIEEKLKKLQLGIFICSADGHCMFHALSHQLETRHGIKKSMMELRKIASDVLRKNKDLYSFHVILRERETYEQYCDGVEKGDKWGGQVEIAAIAEFLGLRVFVHQTTLTTHGKPLEIGGKNGKVIHITFHKYFLCGEHYNSVVDTQ